MTTKNNYVLIMAGGVGSRFWPVSRSSFPKQFIDVLGTGKTLIQTTYERFTRIVSPDHIFIITNEAHVGLVHEQISELPKENIIGEPMMRNTAACIAYASNKINCINPEANLVVAPADHLILDVDKFVHDIKEALYHASNDWLITLGIRPSRPDTGYGYIQYVEKDTALKKVKIFTEKPNLELAKTFVQSGDFLWNAGIFIWSVKSILNAFEQYQAEMYELFNEGCDHYQGPKAAAFIANAYTRCASISIDYAIMEKADNVYVLPTDFGWSDLGTWASIYELGTKDEQKNVTHPTHRIVMRNSTNCIVNVPLNKLVVLSGLNDYIVVESNDTLLICPREDEQSVKEIVSEVKEKYGTDYI
ncbi:mannose-1-phosphate guanylyltransferase [Olivibacter ginsenosidimutans]